MNSKLKFAATAIGIGGVLSMAVKFTHTMLLAYVQPSKSILVRIDTIGEADLEMALLAIIWGLFAYTIYLRK
jgi:hypothetical protein